MARSIYVIKSSLQWQEILENSYEGEELYDNKDASLSI